MRLALAAVLTVLASAAFADDAPPGALACSGCHGSGAEAALPLDGLTAEEIATALEEFRSGARAATLMDRIAKGFTPEESQAIAHWIAEDKP